VAFAKTGPLARLATEIDRWLDRKKTIEAVFGVDHQGTSKQALEFALKKFTTTWVLHVGPRATFHPKMYFFTGPRRARLFVGSHNLTVGGTEVNWESGVVIDIDRSQDEQILNQAIGIWKSLVGSSAKLDKTNLAAYEAAGLLLDETKQQRRRSRGRPTAIEAAARRRSLLLCLQVLCLQLVSLNRAVGDGNSDQRRRH
jgi:PLD-like domain